MTLAARCIGFVILLSLGARANCAEALPEAVMFTGRVGHPRFAGSAERMALSTVQVFASRDGGEAEALGFRTWETDPPGWYRVSGMPGRYTLIFSGPAHFIRPTVVTNQFAQAGETVSRIVTPQFDYAVFDEKQWDSKAARQYDQLFVARGTSITQVGFKPVHDGVDGVGPGGQDVWVSIHRKGNGSPETWEQVGPAMAVVNVDCGGPKSYWFSAGWNSGEVPTVAGGTYAVRIRPKAQDGVFQMFWRPCEDKNIECYRTATDGTGAFAGHSLWMAVASDCDGVVVPYNKRVHKAFGSLTKTNKKWSQTYVAQGRSLASAILYAAVSGAQPPLTRQRTVVRVRRSGPEGAVVGAQKIAIGNGNYTGDASWGMFGVTYSPGEVPLEPGQMYAIEFESIETYETLHGFVNIKGQISDDRAVFNPYRKHSLDDYPLGTAYMGGAAQDFDLDMQIVEYRHVAGDWAAAVDEKNLLANGDMQTGELDAAHPEAGKPEGWTAFSIEPGTVHHYACDGAEPANRILRVIGGSFNKQTVDGGYVQQVTGLSALETYRISGHVRSSWPLDERHASYVGYDLTGQTSDPKAASIVWKPAAGYHGVFIPFLGEPLRPKKDSISIWLRGRTTMIVDTPFRADFDEFRLQRVRSEAPPGGIKN